MTETVPKNYAEGIGEAVANRTINRLVAEQVPTTTVYARLERKDNVPLDKSVANYAEVNGILYSEYEVRHGDDQYVDVTIEKTGEIRRESWAEVADRVALGNSLLAPQNKEAEYKKLYHHIAEASLLMSGRHLQHGDETQPTRPQEVFTNCSTSAMSFISFYLLLNGSGVGRSYDDEMMLVDWRDMPVIQCVIDGGHADVLSGEITGSMDMRTAKHLYADSHRVEFKVEDSREGWAYAVAALESLAYEGMYGSVLLLDFSDVRHRGSPIAGMQDRPASGPGPLMDAMANIAKIRGTNMAPWKATMFVDHYLAECVLVGGARRAARMATKTWRDASVLEFAKIKRAIELSGLEGQDIADKIEQVQDETGMAPQGFLYSSNNSVMVDQEFWSLVDQSADDAEIDFPNDMSLWLHAQAVIKVITQCSYFDGTGEPGIINADKLTTNLEGADYEDGKFAESSRFKLPANCQELAQELASIAKNSAMPMIVNPCGEICLYKLGGYCVIADVVPFHASSDEDAIEAFKVATRALIRTNTMDCVYGPEVRRTNRIGVGMTGLHEYAWSRFGYGWKDLVDESKSLDFWQMLSVFKRAVADEAERYSKELGLNVPHTNTTMKPSGTCSKLFGLSEGAHLPSMREYIRWVQYRSDDPLLADFRAKGYPVRDLKVYQGTTIVGFPTQPIICSLGMEGKLDTAAEATPEEQYEYLRLLEKWYMRGMEADNVTPLEETGNQVSYTLKYLPSETDFDTFRRTLIDGQSSVRCCSVMPQADGTAYEYQPEQPVNKAEFEMISRAIIREETGDGVVEDIGIEHVDCSTGACPIFFDESDKVA